VNRLPISTINNIRYLLKWRWWIVALLALSIIFSETVEHRWSREQTVDSDYWAEIIKYGIGLPLFEGIVLSVIDHAAAKSLDRVVQNERQNIAREIHDSIGQNLSYLHLKLESLAASGTLDSELARELEQVRAVADEAYKQVRGTLAKLDLGDSTDMAAVLFDQARSLGRRANFTVDFAAAGLPSPLPLNTQLAIIYIFREALINVEKHANAQKVGFRVTWERDALTVHLSDDGNGFAPDALLQEGHFGLKIMRDRASEINSKLTLISQPGTGTEVTLRVPIPKA
jgi:two-component system, NarL family, nitrate/nitrite sensor histidine kinase NarX